MKKIFVILAFVGIVAASSASTIATLSKGTIVTLNGEDKKGDDKKKKESLLQKRSKNLFLSY